ncbi:MAG: hypothetical protein ACRDOH_01050 [Streptosporangiaceae bacterium]
MRETGRLLLLLRVDDGGHDAGLDVIDVAGDQHVGRDLVGPHHSLDIGTDRAGRLQDGCVGESSLIDAHSLGEAVPQLVVGEQGRSAVGVVNDCDLEAALSAPGPQSAR